jgi:3'-5' exoribonuclease
LSIGSYFEPVNRDLLICAGLIHDIGKLKSYDVDEDKIKISKTDWDSLLGHLSMSTIFLSKIIPSDFDSHKAMLLYHMILSHHGELQHGSPVGFKTKEAYIMHKADQISSTLNHVSALNFTNNWAKDELTQRSWYNKLGE